MNQGFILLHRKFMSWEWYQDKNTKILFIHCLLKANFEKKEWQGITIKRGQFFTSINHLSTDLKMSIKEIRTALKKLQKTNEIVQKGASNGTMITVCKYADYQVEIKPKGKPRANEGQAKGKRGATTNNDKQLNKVNNKIYPDFFNENLIKTYNEFKIFRVEKKKTITETQEPRFIEKLEKLSRGQPNLAAKILIQSIENGWQGIFELKSPENNDIQPPELKLLEG